MKKLLLTACAVSAVIASWQVSATAAKPSIDWAPQDYSFVQVNLEGQGSYKDLVTAKEQVDISIKWNAWGGTGGDSYKVYFDDMMVNEGSLTAGTNSGVISFPYKKSGRHSLTIELCDADGCVRSDAKAIVIADTDGGHLQPLTMDVDANNKTYQHQEGTVVGAYFVEWGIYGRDFDVSNIPAQNLTHLLYGFIPICGANESLKEIENGNSWRALEKACGGSADYEVVVHDPWAAFQKALPGINTTDPIRGTYAQLMALKQRYPDLKVLPSVGGWTLSDPFHGFTDKANRDTFVASMKKFLQTWKFYDGVDIDWEFPGGSGPNPDLGDPINDGPAYVALMAELRVMLDELEADTGREYQLTSAIGVGYDKIEDVDYSLAIQSMDYIFAMSYDFFGGWNNVTGHQTGIYCGEHLSVGECDGTGLDDAGEPRKGPAYTMDNGIQQLLAQGVPASQLVVGTAMYGRGWEGVKEANTQSGNPMTTEGTGKLTGTSVNGVWEPGIQDYKGIKKVMIGASGEGINGFQTYYDEQADAAYVWNKSSGTLVTYDSPRSVNAKGQYVRSLGLAGLFAWEIDADNGDILNAMHDGLAGGTPPNYKPVVKLNSTFTVKSGEQLIIAATATDADNDPLSYAWSYEPLMASGGNTDTLTVTAPIVTVNKDYKLTLSVSDQKSTVTKETVVTVLAETTGNEAPVISPIADVNVDETKSVAINVSASDADGDSLAYTWDVPAGLTLQGSGSDIKLVAGNVNADTDYQVTINVSDTKVTTSETFTVTVKNTDIDTGDTTWDASKVYNTGDKVKYNGVEYRAKWWSKGNVPTAGNPWEEVIPDDGQLRAWKASSIYNGGDKVSHSGDEYQAKWWTKGEEPGAANVWKKLN